MTVGGDAVTITRSSGTGSIGSVTDNGNGTYTATVTSPTATGSGLFVATVNGSSVNSGGGSQTQSTITYTPGVATKLVFTTSPVTVVAGVASSTITVQRQDVNNNPNTADANRTVTLASTSTGTVTFSGGTSVTIPNGSSSVSFTYTDTKAGSPTITAASTSPTTITSATQVETVNKAAPTISGVTASQSITYGTATVALSGTVSATGGIYPANGETVTVTINGANANAVVAGGTGGFVVNFNTAAIPYSASAYPITYAYAGNANLNAAANHTSTALTVNQASTSIAVSSSINPSGFTTNVTFTATLPAAATGNVTFKTNGVTLTSATLSSGTATAATTLLPRGTNTITAEYVGDGNYLGSSNNLSGGQVVTNRPPVAGNATYTRATGSGLFINIANLLTNVTQRAADHVITLSSVGSGSQGATITISGASIRYSPLPAHNANDSFTYTVSDGQGGTATGNVAVNNRSSTGQVTGQVTVTTNSVTSLFTAVPGWTYYVQRSTNLSVGVGWISINTNLVPTSGLITNVDNFTDLGTPPASAFYRLFLQ